MQKVTIGVYPNPPSDPGVLEAGQIQSHGLFARWSRLPVRIVPPTHQIESFKIPDPFGFYVPDHAAAETDLRRRR